MAEAFRTGTLAEWALLLRGIAGTRTHHLKDRTVSFASESLRVMVGTISISSLVPGAVNLGHVSHV